MQCSVVQNSKSTYHVKNNTTVDCLLWSNTDHVNNVFGALQKIAKVQFRGLELNRVFHEEYFLRILLISW